MTISTGSGSGRESTPGPSAWWSFGISAPWPFRRALSSTRRAPRRPPLGRHWAGSLLPDARHRCFERRDCLAPSAGAGNSNPARRCSRAWAPAPPWDDAPLLPTRRAWSESACMACWTPREATVALAIGCQQGRQLFVHSLTLAGLQAKHGGRAVQLCRPHSLLHFRLRSPPHWDRMTLLLQTV